MTAERNWEDKLTAAYIRDDHFSWLPVDVISYTNNDEAIVRLALPDDWYSVTHNPNHLSLKKSQQSNGDGSILRKVKLSEYARNILPLRNIDENGDIICKRNLGDLSFLHEASILYNLRYFHSKGAPYTRVNEIVVSLNPFYWIDGMYSDEKQKFYAETFVWNDYIHQEKKSLTDAETINEIEPHIYETSCKAYRGMIVDNKSQTILVAGVSGAGKTETVKIVMKQLATMYQTKAVLGNSLTKHSESYSRQLKERIKTILESNPIFESFGNAKTVRNDNSSRFGKFTELIFDVEKGGVACTLNEEMKNSDKNEDQYVPSSTLIGSAFQTFLLEKSRVVEHSPGERSFHIFYQLLSAPEQEKCRIWDGLRNQTYIDFNYLSKNAAPCDIDDKAGWEQTKCALKGYGMNGEIFVSLFRAICIVLQLGNLRFSSSNENEDISTLKSDNELVGLCNVMGLSEDNVTKFLTTRAIHTKTDHIIANLNLNEAMEARDALAKESYFQLFTMLVERMNEYSGNLQKSQGISRSISLLDLFGFESFPINRFEQLCINYANERLQKVYVLDNFYQVQEEYMKEGLTVSDFSDVDNSEIIDMIQGTMGLIPILNDECLRPQGNDAAFVLKLKAFHKKSESLVHKPLHRPTEFAINHFAGIVTYDATNFVKKNTDEISIDILVSVSKCTNHFIRHSFQNLLNDRLAMEQKKRRKIMNTIISKFRSQLNDLVIHISSTQSRYIRCIKPNNMNAPYILDHMSTMKQLASSGLVTIITISRQAYLNSLHYKDFVKNFRCLSRSKETCSLRDEKMIGRDIVEECLGKLNNSESKTTKPYTLGKTKIFFKPGALEILESEKMGLYYTNATIIQSWVRMLNAVLTYRSIRNGSIVVLIQSKVRGFLARSRYQMIKACTIIIQCAVRCARARHQLYELNLNHCATMIQCRWRFMQTKKQLDKNRNAAKVIQRAWLSSKNRSIFVASMAVIVEQAQKEQQLKYLQKEIKSIDKNTSENALLLECSSIMNYHGLELFKSRSHTSNLKAQLENAVKENHSLENKLGRMSELCTANEIEVVFLRNQIQQLKARIEDKSQIISEMKTERSSIISTNAEQTAYLSNKIAQVSTSYQEKIEKLKSQRKDDEKKYRAEKQALQNENEELEKKHAAQIKRLKWSFENDQAEMENNSFRMLNLFDAFKPTPVFSANVLHSDDREIGDVIEKNETESQTCENYGLYMVGDSCGACVIS